MKAKVSTVECLGSTWGDWSRRFALRVSLRPAALVASPERSAVVLCILPVCGVKSSPCLDEPVARWCVFVFRDLLWVLRG
jgi:hypothetical protein